MQVGINKKRYGVGFFGAIAAGFAAGIVAAFGLQNPGSALIQSSLT
jgi:fructose-specific phosphotransferase system IIC component